MFNLPMFFAAILTFYYLLEKYEQMSFTSRITAMIQAGEQTVAEKEKSMSITDILGESEGVMNSMKAFNVIDSFSKSGMFATFSNGMFYIVSTLSLTL